jgi:Zn-dependent protease with chaperone function
MHSFPFPPAPQQVQPIKPGSEFRKAVAKVAASIIFFLFVYIVLMVGAVLLAVACFYGGVFLMAALTNWLGIIGGVGLMAVGVSVVFFLIKFIFATSKNEDPARIRIYEKDEPQLFAFLRQLAKDTHTKFPKKTFISPGVNACVFYNSSFWSMFFPVRKNLEIGLGLVNSINLSEFKAIMAHEFGHFSQQSMKLGSFTYNVNRIIYNMLFQNDSYTKFLSGWGQVHWILSLFASITVAIATAIQNILKSVYTLINKHYMGLSRQMEYNADAIAASVAGGNNLVSSLYRFDLCDSSFNTALNKADEFLKENKISGNIYTDHRNVFEFLAAEFHVPVVNGLPQVSDGFMESFGKSRINYKDQWASHPTTQERAAELAKLNMDVAPDTQPAWSIFSNTLQLQTHTTKHIYRDIQGAEQMQVFEPELLSDKLKTETEKYKLPGVYKKFYDGRIVDMSEWDFMEIQSGSHDSCLADILTDENICLPELIRSNESDLVIMQAIAEKNIDVKSFDFDGKKYDRSEAAVIIDQLSSEITHQKKELETLDKRMYRLLCHRALGEGFGNVKLNDLVNNYRKLAIEEADFTVLHKSIVEVIAPFYQGGLSVEAVNDRVHTLRYELEKQLKGRLMGIKRHELLSSFLSPELVSKIENYVAKNYYYFQDGQFHNEDLEAIHSICSEVGDALSEMRFSSYKKMLQEQAALVA